MGALNVKRFVEKPGLEKATEYVQSGRFFWNAGMFLWTVSAIDAAFEKHAPALHATASACVIPSRRVHACNERVGGVLPRPGSDFC
jgi:mannose-1-phosphate guanylyltransferase / mannose-6-phosphate isomerase